MALALAFVGGMVLNLMPCVFPVLSIKLLGLAKQDDRPAALRTHALAYGGGVLLSFLALALGLIALQAAGSAVGWGFQLQEPGMVFVLALLFFAIGLNLMGVYEFANLLPQRAAQWRAQRPAGDAFACGVLAVVAASPCTAPFMGAALGYAMTQSRGGGAGGVRGARPGHGAALHGAGAGAGLAPAPAAAGRLDGAAEAGPGLPDVRHRGVAAVGAGPAGRRRRDGAGADGPGGSGTAAVAGAHRRPARRARQGRRRAWRWPACWPGAGRPRPPAGSAAGSAAPRAQAAEDAWLPYDEAALARLPAEGRPVFVDFTAAWCVSCQVNKRLVLNTDGDAGRPSSAPTWR